MKKLFFAFLFLPIFIFSQELRATVDSNVEQLTSYSKEQVVNFADEVADYLNNTKFTELEIPDENRIKCQFTIFFTGGTSDKNYTAQVVVHSTRPIYKPKKESLMISLMDSKWSFHYEQGQTMYYDQLQFDGLTSFLDYYALVIIGFDSDTYDPHGGNQFFAEAVDICVLGASSQFSDGWQISSSAYSRRGLVDDLVNAKFEKFRDDIYDYHYNGLDNYSRDPAVAHKMIVKLVDDLAKERDNINARSVFLKVFFDAKSGEIVDFLQGYENKEVFEKLKLIDIPHISKYNEMLDKM